ncbi:ABC transporter permease [Clostridium sp. LP20]|uniref:ABC transporter permease n=1 Tax=Clostridium sp. LP20 TaxID=3418665 RepID=UPI003EE6794F
MNSIKLVLKNIMKDKRFNSFLIVFSIMMSSALFFATSSINAIMKKNYVDQIRKDVGSTEIQIKERNTTEGGILNSENLLFSIDLPLDYDKYIDYKVGVVKKAAFYKESEEGNLTAMNLKGIDYTELEKFTSLSFTEEKDVTPFEDNKIIISDLAREKYGLEVGDKIKVNIDGSEHEFSIAAVNRNTGIFMGEGDSITAVVPAKMLNKILGKEGEISTLYIKLNDSGDKEYIIDKLRGEFPDKKVGETITEGELDVQTKTMSTLFSLTSIIVFFISIFLIYTSFAVIIAERLPVLGTLRSIGATKIKINTILIIETVIYGVIGSALGALLGIIILKLMVYGITPSNARSNLPAVEINKIYLLASFAMGVILSLVSSIVPILKVIKISIKDIVLNNMETNESKISAWKYILGILFIIVSIFLPSKVEGKISLPIIIICIFITIIGIALVVPMIKGLFIKIFEKINLLILGNEGYIAASNLRDNKSIQNIIILLSIGIACIFMINVSTTSTVKGIVNSFTDNILFQGTLSLTDINKEHEDRLKEITGVKEITKVYSATNVEVEGSETAISQVQGINNDSFSKFYNVDIVGDDNEVLDKLKEGDNIILSNILKNRYNVEKDDFISIYCGNKKVKFKVVGFMNTLIWRGDYALISSENFIKYYGSQNHTVLDIKIDDDNIENTIELIKDEFEDENAIVISMEAYADSITSDNLQLYSILDGFSILTAVAGIFGLINNLILNHIKRKHSLAVLKSIGMSKKQVIKMLIIEALTTGVVGSIIGIIGGLLLLRIIPYFIIAIDSPPITILYESNYIIGIFLAGIIITLVASVLPALKASKLNIVESIKYE